MRMSPLDMVTQLRFDGYTVEMLALEIDMLRSGSGTSTMANAVDAVAAVAAAVGHADDTLREELGKLGVAWESEGASIAQGVMAASADFAAEATDKLNGTAQVAFELSEAFSRALNTLPDSQTLRAGAEGLSAVDMLADLIGHETDHAAVVRAASTARDQAVDALNQLAGSCGEALSGIRPISEPGAIVLADGGPPRSPGGGAQAGYQAMAAAADAISDPDPEPGGTTTAPMAASPSPVERQSTTAAGESTHRSSGADGVAATAAAMGAAGIAGAVSAEPDRGRAAMPVTDGARPDFDVGTMAEEAEANAAAAIESGDDRRDTL